MAAVQNSLAHMSMPRQQQHHAAHCHPLPVAPQQQLQPEPNQSQQPELTSFDPSPPLKAGRRTLLPSPPGAPVLRVFSSRVLQLLLQLPPLLWLLGM